MGATPNARPNHQILIHSITHGDTAPSTVTYRDRSGLADELWRLWSKTESRDRVLWRLGQMLEHADTVTAVHLVSLWRHIACTAEVFREDREIELFNLIGSADLAEVRF